MTIQKTTAKLSAGLLVATLALAGCSDDPEPAETTPTVEPTTETTPETETSPETETTPTPETSPETETSPDSDSTEMAQPGDTFTGTGYQVVVPDGWVQYDGPEVAGAEFVLITEPRTESSVNVVPTPTGGADLDSILEQAKPAMESVLNDITDAPEKTLDGQPAKGISGTHAEAGLAMTQYYSVNNEMAYVVTFTGPAAADFVDEFFGAWTWTS